MIMETTTRVDIGALQAELDVAVADLTGRREAEGAARSAACTALNRVNEIQKKIDKAMHSLKQSTQFAGTDWARRNESKP